MKSISQNARLWIYAGICFAFIAYLVYSFVTKELNKYRLEIQSINRKIDIKKAELSKIIAQSQRKGKLQLDIAKAERDFQQLKEMFPDKDSIPKRLQDLIKATRNASVAPISFKPLKSSEKEFYLENNYEIIVASTYHGLGAFFEEVANFKYPTSITNVAIQQDETIRKEIDYADLESLPSTIRTSFQLKTYSSKK